jgi:hypothetical protein
MCAIGRSTISESIVPSRTRTCPGLDSDLLRIGEPQFLQKYFVCPGDDSYPLREFAPETIPKSVALTMPLVAKALP